MSSEKLESYDCGEYRQYTDYRELIKAFNTLAGILDGINIDRKINDAELQELHFWCSCQRQHQNRHPFKEVLPIIDKHLSDGILSKEEYEDIVWLCKKFRPNSLFENLISTVSQELQGILHGVMADNIVTEEEAFALSEWLERNSILQGLFPYDEIYALLTAVLHDRKLDEFEAKMLKSYFANFIDISESANLNRYELAELQKEICLPGICAVCPEIVFENNVFCFTGESARLTRKDIALTIENNGGIYNDTVTKKTTYLLVGGNGNPCWQYSCYGRKVEKAMTYRKSGAPIQIVHENDFWDALMA